MTTLISVKSLGKKTILTTLNSRKGSLIEVRQHDSISGENIVMLDKETILKLVEMINGSEK